MTESQYIFVVRLQHNGPSQPIGCKNNRIPVHVPVFNFVLPTDQRSANKYPLLLELSPTNQPTNQRTNQPSSPSAAGASLWQATRLVCVWGRDTVMMDGWMECLLVLLLLETANLKIDSRVVTSPACLSADDACGWILPVPRVLPVDLID